MSHIKGGLCSVCVLSWEHACITARDVDCTCRQGQANKWIKNMEGGHGLRVLNLGMTDLLRQMENAIQFGNPVLLQASVMLCTLSNSL